ncbi:hypothetical protein SAY87_025981 [Trapa incisa]|uniref:Uncharacterized protein n=1 Tax=Trapa incisa TaxID=236973 RepID=A0AAN7GRD1_9MYRT|nr:hypothetical protein SAY87_025981 [Trapa incisa]
MNKSAAKILRRMRMIVQNSYAFIDWVRRNGFSAKKGLKDGIGIFTTSTSCRAFESIEIEVDGLQQTRKALIVCRVIAGRVHRPLENIKEIAGQTGFDSLAGKVGLYSHIEEHYLLNRRALLPCHHLQVRLQKRRKTMKKRGSSGPASGTRGSGLGSIVGPGPM